MKVWVGLVLWIEDAIWRLGANCREDVWRAALRRQKFRWPISDAPSGRDAHHFSETGSGAGA